MRESLLWVFVLGIVLDVLAIDPMGANGLALVPLVVLSHPLRIRPWQFNMTSVMLLVFLGTFIHGALLAILRGVTPGIIDLGLQAVMHVLIVPLTFLGMRMLGR